MIPAPSFLLLARLHSVGARLMMLAGVCRRRL